MGSYFVWVHSLAGTGGQASVTRSVVSICIGAGYKVQILEYGFSTSRKWYLFFQQYLKFIFSTSAIYAPVSRSFWGAFRDMPVYVLALLGRFLVVHIHGSDFHLLFRHRVLGKFLSYVLRKKTTIIVTNLRSKNELISLGCGTVICIENHFPSEYMAVSNKTKKLNTFFWNSNIIVTKGIFEFLEAFVIYSSDTGATLRISGEILGCSLMSQKDTQDRLSLFLDNSNISYVGKITRLETLKELASAEVCVLTSYSESQPLALIDGMCMGCRIFCSDLPELREMTNQYPSVIYSPVEPAAILANLEALNRSDYITIETSRKQALGRFSEHVYRDKLLAAIVRK